MPQSPDGVLPRSPKPLSARRGDGQAPPFAPGRFLYAALKTGPGSMDGENHANLRICVPEVPKCF